MFEYNLQKLVSKLNSFCRNAMEGAAGLCVSQTNYNVEIEHFLLKVLDIGNSDLHIIFQYYDLKTSVVIQELTDKIDDFKRGSNRTPAFSLHVLQMLHEAWICTSLHLESGKIRSGAILMALLTNETLRGIIFQSIPSLKNISKETLREDIKELIKDSIEQKDVKEKYNDGNDKYNSKLDNNLKSKNEFIVNSSSTPYLDQFTYDLTDLARSGSIDPIEGRNAEIRQIIDILMRKRQNNPILTGDAGVGKTAVVEGLALKISNGDVPPCLKNVSLLLLDLGLLQAGAGIRGEFEKRLNSVITEVANSISPIILFIDEAHTLIGAGSVSGQGDAANMLKPALARGELRTIAATTWNEYKKYFEKDSALARRFQVVRINEPEEHVAVQMLRGAVFNLEKHHKIKILDEAINDAVKLSNRYITGRQLPDKAVSVLDTACARVSISQKNIPPVLDDTLYQIELLELEASVLNRELHIGKNKSVKLKKIINDLERLNDNKKALEEKWAGELKLFTKIDDLEQKIQTLTNNLNPEKDKIAPLINELGKTKKELVELQNGEPMISICVDSHVIASVVSGWTGIPIGKMMLDEIETILNLNETMGKKIIGQSKSIESICKRIQTSRANLEDPDKPIGVFMLIGPSGIGKTETSIALSEILYGGEKNLIKINMSEYQEAHSVSKLKGAPPGYIGYGQGGVLTEAVRQKPFSIILLDEIEKAHPDVMEMFYQVLDKGVMEDSEGITVNFKNTIIFLTSNIGSDVIVEEWKKNNNHINYKLLINKLRPDLLKYFKPAFLGRLIIIPYLPLGSEQIKKIITQKLTVIKERVWGNHRVRLNFEDNFLTYISKLNTETESGARNIDNILANTILPKIGTIILQQMAKKEKVLEISLSLTKEEKINYEIRCG